MAELIKRLTLDNVDMSALLGFNDKNLAIIEERFSTDIFIRGENVVIKGVEDEVEIVEKILKEMVYVLNKNGSIKENDIKTIIDLTIQGKEIINGKDLESIVLYTKNDVVKAKSPGQLNYLEVAQKNDICFAIGPAGTGKTYLAVALAVSALKKSIVNKIVLARPAVEAGESLGYLPGDIRDKIDPYLRPLYDSLEDMLPSEKLKAYIEKGTIEIVPLAYMRGRTLNSAFVILDEAQNSTDTQMKMFLTRLGANSKAIVTGDITQIDLPLRTVSGLVKAQEILHGIQGVGFVYFDKTDVVRHKLVKDIIDAYEKYYEK
ncbi:MAG: phosphate starvation-inducible protein PhoH [Chlorobiaceae bacterium]|nr:phosphate starvation-inducible protein PhoH [Chlorobiaceae bacterium]MBA4308838.1 phosphate starvation-inducible protein PhoH [Chlorobiaceae bacterium]